MNNSIAMENLINNFTNTTGRSVGQTIFLLHLCSDSFYILVDLEEKIKSNHIFYCPSNKEQVSEILTLPRSTTHLTEWRIYKDPSNQWCLIFTDKKGAKHFVAVPPTDGDRIDYLDNREGNEWVYHYSVKPDGFRGVEIPIKNGVISFPFFK